MLSVRTRAYRDRAQVSHPPHGTSQNELIRINSGQHQAQERQPSVGSRDAAKSHNPCDSIQTQLRGVLGRPISLAWGKALDLETCAGNAQEALATHFFATITVQPRQRGQVCQLLLLLTLELQAMPKAKPASAGLEPGPDVQEVGIPIHISILLFPGQYGHALSAAPGQGQDQRCALGIVEVQ